jgi:hypothetical protein
MTSWEGEEVTKKIINILKHKNTIFLKLVT